MTWQAIGARAEVGGGEWELTASAAEPREDNHARDDCEGEGDEHASQLSMMADVGLTNGHGALMNGHGHGHGKLHAPHPEDNGRVLCTTELGLRCITRRDVRSSTASEAGVGDPFDHRMLLLPKVLLDTAMDVIERG